MKIDDRLRLILDNVLYDIILGEQRYDEEDVVKFSDKLITEIKKAVASEGLGVEELEKILDSTIMGKALSGRWVRWSKNPFGISTYLSALTKTAKAIHEAQTKYKKEKGEK